MGKRKGDPAIVQRLRTLLHKIFAANGPGASSEAFGDDFFLLNMSSRVNAGEELTREQRARVDAIWRRLV